MYSAFASWGTLNSRQAASFFVRLVEGEERWEVSDHLQGDLSQTLGRPESNRTVFRIMLKDMSNDRRTTSTLYMEMVLK
ncbi:hypothetical protein TNCV_1459641 [Trichonephila clavipes]|nr:hypothetical protein TNCV_1459641 [Trichonephila clavipes]